jgi:hypothetical protein
LNTLEIQAFDIHNPMLRDIEGRENRPCGF